MTDSIFLLFLGSIMLYLGSEWIVKGGVAIAEKYGISTIVIGLTVVAFGTSLPELLVSLNAALQGSTSIAVGNAIGSNVANVGLVLALSALIFPISLNYKLIKRDLWIYLISCAIFVLFSLDGRLSKFEGAFFVSSLLFYIIFSIKRPIKTDNEIEKSNDDNFGEKVLFVIFGIVGLSLGADIFVDGSIYIARFFGISEIAPNPPIFLKSPFLFVFFDKEVMKFTNLSAFLMLTPLLAYVNLFKLIINSYVIV